MNNDQAITSIDLASCSLKKVASGKVRELFEVNSTTLLFVATDRISAFDVVLENVRVIPSLALVSYSAVHDISKAQDAERPFRIFS